MRRLFVALEVPEAVRRRVAAATDDLRRAWEGLRWTPPSQWHVTLAFLGAVDAPPEEVGAVVGTATAAAPPVITLRLGTVGRFGKRVLWLGIDDEPPRAVAELGCGVQQALKAADLPVDEKEVHPHLTLARARGRRRDEAVRGAAVEAVPVVEAQWEVREAVLFESVPGGHRVPNRYVALIRLPLGGSSRPGTNA